MARDRHRVEPERLEQGEQVALVVGESIGVAMLAEAVTPEVERDHAQIVEERDDAQPVALVAGQPVEEDHRRSPAVIAEGKPFRRAILRDRLPALWPSGPLACHRVMPCHIHD
jgi:hypothetical protein